MLHNSPFLTSASEPGVNHPPHFHDMGRCEDFMEFYAAPARGFAGGLRGFLHHFGLGHPAYQEHETSGPVEKLSSDLPVLPSTDWF